MKVSITARLAVGFFLMFAAMVALAHPPGSGYHLLKSVPIGAAPGDAEHLGAGPADL